MNKDAELLAEAYQRVLEEAKHCKAAIDGCDCDKCEECEDNQAVNEAKKSRRPDKDGDGVPDWADKKSGKDDNADKKGKLTQAENRERFKKMVAGKKKSMHKENAEMGQAYETILEFKQINKKFARRYNKVTAAMLKAQPGSEEYGALKTEREDLVAILRDHDQTPKDLEAFLVKKEKITLYLMYRILRQLISIGIVHILILLIYLLQKMNMRQTCTHLNQRLLKCLPMLQLLKK
jgi:hypothetical protein